MNVTLNSVAIVQSMFAVRVIARFRKIASRSKPDLTLPSVDEGTRLSVVVPVLNESHRLPRCLAGLAVQSEVNLEILIVDGGSTDDTVALAREAALNDPRIRVITAGEAPRSTNGKVHNLEAGLRASDPSSSFIVTIDADVLLSAGVCHELFSRAISSEAGVLSVATRQQLQSRGAFLLHPAMLTTLVYRFGPPGMLTSDPELVQANGQCMIIRRDVLDALGGFAPFHHTIAEDFAIARKAASAGYTVGLLEFESDATVAMYASASDTWNNWPRSLPLPEQQSARHTILGLFDLSVVQTLPLLILAMRVLGVRLPGVLVIVNTALFLLRLGVLIGTAKAYRPRSMLFWLSPLSDGPVTYALWRSLLRKDHQWRGRSISRGNSL
ncbi:glycosyltransferase family 2 protein [soil metagenome]